MSESLVTFPGIRTLLKSLQEVPQMPTADFDTAELEARAPKRPAPPQRARATPPSKRPQVKTAWGRKLMRSIDKLHQVMEAEGVKLG